MSYDISLVADLGGPDPVSVGYLDWNYTSNCSRMWNAAGADLASFDGRPAKECAVVLAAAISKMESDPKTFEAMNPTNGWGSYETLLPRLRVLLQAFDEAPHAIVQVGC